MIGWAAVVIGAVLALSQVVADTPWQAGLLLGVLLVIGGAARIDARRAR